MNKATSIVIYVIYVIYYLLFMLLFGCFIALKNKTTTKLAGPSAHGV